MLLVRPINDVIEVLGRCGRLHRRCSSLEGELDRTLSDFLAVDDERLVLRLHTGAGLRSSRGFVAPSIVAVAAGKYLLHKLHSPICQVHHRVYRPSVERPETTRRDNLERPLSLFVRLVIMGGDAVSCRIR